MLNLNYKFFTAFVISLIYSILIGISFGVEESLDQKKFIHFASQLDLEEMDSMPVYHHGRIKPFQTMSRESIVEILGSYQKWGLVSTSLYFAIMTYENLNQVPLIEVRSVAVKKMLGMPTQDRFTSLKELENRQFSVLIEPVLNKERRDSKTLSEEEKEILDLYHQKSLLEEIQSGFHLGSVIDWAFLDHSAQTQPSPEKMNPDIRNAFSGLLQAVQSLNLIKIDILSKNLKAIVEQQKQPEQMGQLDLGKINLEIFYNKFHPFRWSYLFFFFCSLILLVSRKKISGMRGATGIYVTCFLLPVLFLITGVAMRVNITGFAPVTNMYETMLWVAFGIALFNSILFFLYRNEVLAAFLMIGSGLTLLLVDSIPLILSPNMDPLVAVLRNNFWLSTHVLTITISYAAFAIAMIIGNVVLVRNLIYKLQDPVFEKQYATYAYRAIQLGVFCLTVGIILGGIWADYSWGRFWGWDPKETWALIADMGFIVILHARYSGLIKDFGLLLWSTVSFLLVIMAWYGVNFILASGLHSYGFSSGGAFVVGVFVSLQLLLILLSILKKYSITSLRPKVPKSIGN